MNEKSVTTITLKKINKRNVYRYIYRNRLASKLQIVQDLHMGLSTVSQNLNVLEEEGLIERKGSFDSTGGRKAQAIRIVPDKKISIGLGILKQMYHIVAVDLYGETLCRKTIATPYSNTEEYYRQVAENTEAFLHSFPDSEDRVLGVAVATQGIISPDGSSVTYGAIMDNKDMKLSDFSSRLSYPCRLEHDSRAAAYLEWWNHRELDNAIVLLLNHNLGGAVITNGKVHQGVSMHSGTIEHMCIHSDGPLCYCGNRGCLETYCSANTLETAARMPASEFFTLLRGQRQPGLVSLWNDYLDHLAFAVRNLNMIIDAPVIISGYLAPYFTEEDISRLLQRINASSPFPMQREQIVLGTHGQYTPAIGAALYYVEEFIQSI